MHTPLFLTPFNTLPDSLVGPLPCPLTELELLFYSTSSYHSCALRTSYTIYIPSVTLLPQRWACGVWMWVRGFLYCLHKWYEHSFCTLVSSCLSFSAILLWIPHLLAGSEDCAAIHRDNVLTAWSRTHNHDKTHVLEPHKDTLENNCCISLMWCYTEGELLQLCLSATEMLLHLTKSYLSYQRSWEGLILTISRTDID